LPATLSDISAGGIGFVLASFLPPGTRLITCDLLSPVIPEMESHVYRLETVWCSIKRPFGYRLGAKFYYPAEKDQDEMVRMINRLQMLRLSKYCRIVGGRQEWL